MKTLSHHTILYDDECPLCKTYTAGFVRSKMLDENGRVAFSEIPEDLACHINRERACNEIALIDVNSGKVTYGVESLFAILQNRFPVLGLLFKWRLFTITMTYIYSFISYNRKVILPGKTFEGDGKCIPTFHHGYRWSYIIFAWFISSFVLSKFTLLLAGFLPEGNLYREYVICAGQIVFQAITVSLVRRDRVVHYLGNMMTISLAGSILLIPMLAMNHFIKIDGLVALGWFGVVINLMFLEHLRRTKILQIHFLSSVSWVVYRLLVLAIIFYLL